MKKLSLITFIFLFAGQYLYAQKDTYVEYKTPEKTAGKNKKASHFNPAKCRKAYVGLSMGINNPSGFLGFDIDIPIVPNFSIGAGIGSSTWGTKVYIDGKYYMKPCHRGWAFGIGVTHNAGMNNFMTNLETIYGTEQVTVDLLGETNAFLGAYYFWTIGRRYNRFYLEAGYSARFSSVQYTEVSGDPLDNNGQRVLQILSPGGLMIGAGFSFGAF